MPTPQCTDYNVHSPQKTTAQNTKAHETRSELGGDYYAVGIKILQTEKYYVPEKRFFLKKCYINSEEQGDTQHSYPSLGARQEFLLGCFQELCNRSQLCYTLYQVLFVFQ